MNNQTHLEYYTEALKTMADIEGYIDMFGGPEANLWKRLERILQGGTELAAKEIYKL